MTPSVHTPILTAEILDHLALAPGAQCIDATINGGGHASALLERVAPGGRVFGIDRDPDLIAGLRDRLADDVRTGRLVLTEGDFRELTHLAAVHGFIAVQAIVFDLGVSSYHFERSGRGFTFMRDEPLDMRFDSSDRAVDTAAELLNSSTVEELTSLFREFGEERFARRVAGAVVSRRPLRTTAELLDCIRGALPARIRWQAARSAARIFQALRIAVNDELGAIREALPQAVSLLAPGGHLAVLSFHSLEDRVVKRFFLAEQQAGRVRILTKRPLRPSEDETRANSRAASAKLRVCERLASDTPAR